MSYDLPPGIQAPSSSALSSGSSNSSNTGYSEQPASIEVPLIESNPALQANDLSFIVSPVSQPHYDLIASSKSKKYAFANVNQLQVWEDGVVRTVAQLTGQIFDVTYSPHFDTFVAVVTDKGELHVQDVMQPRATFKVLPSKSNLGLKVCWHPSKTTSLAMGYSTGLVCVWDLAVATQNPENVIDQVTTAEVPEFGAGAVNPSLVVIRLPEPLMDLALVGDYVITTGTSGAIRIYHQNTGEMLFNFKEALARNIVIVSQVPLIFVTTSGHGNRQLRTWRIKTTSPLVFSLATIFNFPQYLPLPQTHPAQDLPFRLLRQSSKNMIILSHPALAALWVVNIETNQVYTFGLRAPFTALCTSDPSQGFVGLSDSNAISVQFSDTTTDLVPLVPPSVLSADNATADAPSYITSNGAASEPAAQQGAPANGDGYITLEALRGILAQQNRVYLEGLRENRMLTQKKQAHVLKCLKELPNAIMSAVTPVLEAAIDSQSKAIDVNHIVGAVAESVHDPAAQAMGSYFRDALLPGYQRACSLMTSDMGDVLESASAAYYTQMAPIHTTKVIDPLVTGLAIASNRVTTLFKENNAPSTAPVNTNRTPATANVTPSTSTKTATQPSQTAAATPAVTTPTPSTSNTPTVLSNTSTAKATTQTSSNAASNTAASSGPSSPAVTHKETNTVAASTPSKKKTKVTPNVSSPATPTVASQVVHNPVTSPNTTLAPQATTSVQTPVAVAPPKEQTPPPPRPDPKQTTPVNEATRNSIMAQVSQKQFAEAVVLAIQSGTVEALGFLTSRTDISQWVDSVPQPTLLAACVLILVQTPWPSPSQIQKYSKTLNLILAKLEKPLNVSEGFSNASEMLESAKQWTAGTAVEASAAASIESLAS